MRLGMFMMPVHPAGRSMSDTLAEDTTKSILADQLGFDEVWMGEHFSATTEPFPSPLMFLAGLVPQTKTIQLGTAVINLPNHHPAIVAAEAALSACGYEPRRIVTGGGSDANALIIKGIECVNLANGTEHNHEPTERVSVAALEGMFDVCLALLDEAAVV